jgi:hypothetical protein
MNHLRFTLQPFPHAGPLPSFKITGDVSRRDHTLALRYELLGNLAELVLPPLSDLPARRHGLWEETCFEFFLGVKNSPSYREFNLSPAGHWNAYRFAAYRHGMQEDRLFTSLPFSVRNRGDSWRLSLELHVAEIVPAGQALEIACTAVIKLAGGELSYWALTHRGPRPDFHRRDSFILVL